VGAVRLSAEQVHSYRTIEYAPSEHVCATNICMLTVQTAETLKEQMQAIRIFSGLVKRALAGFGWNILVGRSKRPKAR
jgi:hypothetical protein